MAKQEDLSINFSTFLKFFENLYFLSSLYLRRWIESIKFQTKKDAQKVYSIFRKSYKRERIKYQWSNSDILITWVDKNGLLHSGIYNSCQVIVENTLEIQYQWGENSFQFLTSFVASFSMFCYSSTTFKDWNWHKYKV